MSAIVEFIHFNLERLIVNPIKIAPDLIEAAFEATLKDFQYHDPNVTNEYVTLEITRNSGGLPVFLYRLSRLMHLKGMDDQHKYQIHYLMKTLCSCEIYWSTDIAEGFHIDHGMGTVIGSRSHIGKGFWIHHGCTVGHKSLFDLGEGPHIGDNVILYANSQILGSIRIGDGSVVAANSLVLDHVGDKCVVAGNPAKVVKHL